MSGRCDACGDVGYVYCDGCEPQESSRAKELTVIHSARFLVAMESDPLADAEDKALALQRLAEALASLKGGDVMACDCFAEPCICEETARRERERRLAKARAHRIAEAERAVLEAAERRVAAKERRLAAASLGDAQYWAADREHRRAIKDEDAAVRALREARR